MPNAHDLTAYQNAVWDFILEHSDITRGGALFVKFHTSHRADFERRITARLKGYHREDPKAKEQVKETRQQTFQTTKKQKRARYILSREEHLRALKVIERKNRRRRLVARIKGFLRMR
jgi:hypothetical protein